MSRQQINSSIAYGGPVCTLLTIQALTGVKIPYLGVIDFRGVIEMSNAIGGVEVCVANPIDDPKAKLKLEAGVHTLQGREALAFLRTRYGVGDGSDLARISNQQVFLTSLLRKVKNEGVLNNPIYMYSLANAAARNMKLSDSMTDLGTMVALAGALRNVDLDKMTFLQVPSRGGLSGSEAGRVEPIYDQAQLIFDRIANDQPVVIKKANTGFGASVKETAAPDAESTPTPESGGYSKSGEFVYDHPFQWGSKRTGPDLAREGGLRSNSWHYNHMIEPNSMSPGSIMPAYPWLAENDLNTSNTADKINTIGF
jgi:LCP family protein required for cell wall assembly